MNLLPYKILFKFTSRTSAEQLFSSLDTLLSKIEDKGNYFLIVNLNVDDTRVNNTETKNKLFNYTLQYNFNYSFVPSQDSASEINNDVNKTKFQWDILVNLTDENNISAEGFDNIIRAKMQLDCKNLNGTISFTDKKLQPIIGRKWYDKTIGGNSETNTMQQSPTVLFKFATRSRPQKFKETILSIISNIVDRDNFFILVSADTDDLTMNNEDIKLFAQAHTKYMQIVYGESKSKIHAINRDLERFQEWHILINVSDDNIFEIYGFDNIIRDKFDAHFPDFDGCLWFDDGFTKSKICTQCIIGNKYIRRFRYFIEADGYAKTVFSEAELKLLKKRKEERELFYIYHPNYTSLYCDEEFTTVAKKLDKIVYFDTVICKHNHPSNIGGIRDEQYEKTESYYDYDQRVFENRKALNFDL